MEYSTETIQKLQLLQKKFLAELPERLSNLKTQWLVYVESGDDAAKSNFKLSVHNLAGTAGTFGYLELCDKAKSMELMLHRLPDDHEQIESDLVAITAAIDDLVLLIVDMPDPGLFSQPAENNTDSS